MPKSFRKGAPHQRLPRQNTYFLDRQHAAPHASQLFIFAAMQATMRILTTAAREIAGGDTIPDARRHLLGASRAAIEDIAPLLSI